VLVALCQQTLLQPFQDPSPFQFSPNFTAFVRVIGLITCFLFS
jgi:hypothetical protein